MDRSPRVRGRWRYRYACVRRYGLIPAVQGVGDDGRRCGHDRVSDSNRGSAGVSKWLADLGVEGLSSPGRQQPAAPGTGSGCGPRAECDRDLPREPSQSTSGRLLDGPAAVHRAVCGPADVAVPPRWGGGWRRIHPGGLDLLASSCRPPDPRFSADQRVAQGECSSVSRAEGTVHPARPWPDAAGRPVSHVGTPEAAGSPSV